MITRARTINLVNYPGYPPKLKLHEYEMGPQGPGSLCDPIMNSIISGRSLELIRGEMKMRLSMLKR